MSNTSKLMPNLKSHVGFSISGTYNSAWIEYTSLIHEKYNIRIWIKTYWIYRRGINAYKGKQCKNDAKVAVVPCNEVVFAELCK